MRGGGGVRRRGVQIPAPLSCMKLGPSYTDGRSRASAVDEKLKAVSGSTLLKSRSSRRCVLCLPLSVSHPPGCVSATAVTNLRNTCTSTCIPRPPAALLSSFEVSSSAITASPSHCLLRGAMPPKRRAPATSPQSATEAPEDENNFQTVIAKQPKLDLITEFSRPLHHEVKVKREQNSVKCEPTQSAREFVKGTRTLLSVPYSQKDLAREQFGAEWDNAAKRWYVQNSWCVEDGAIGFFLAPDLKPLIQLGWQPQLPTAFSAKELELCRRWAADDPAAEAELQTAFPPVIVPEPITLLECEYRDKDKVKAMGALFETEKKWHVPNVPVDPADTGYFLHPFHKLVFSPWLPQPPAPPQSPASSQLSNPASPLPAITHPHPQAQHLPHTRRRSACHGSQPQRPKPWKIVRKVPRQGLQGRAARHQTWPVALARAPQCVSCSPQRGHRDSSEAWYASQHWAAV
jgi:hypothetical protein